MEETSLTEMFDSGYRKITLSTGKHLLIHLEFSGIAHRVNGEITKELTAYNYTLYNKNYEPPVLTKSESDECNVLAFNYANESIQSFDLWEFVSEENYEY